MSDLIPGKRYRWTVEGMGVDIGGGEVALETQDRRCFGPGLLANGAIEELPDPLPTTPGSVVMVARDSVSPAEGRRRLVFQLGTDDAWHGTSSQVWTTEELQYEAGGHLHGEITVLFDAGADQ